ncbi:YigZ family protein [Elizabethkingia sp. JS20170427COW]|uniref:IMPACT family protein n=1 Tax=Elizabethkingia sp. JS20170427COW TaxID=2583851 RepID=UPI003517FAB8
MLEYSFQTIEKPIIDIILKEKGSKFISYAFPVEDEEAVKKRLEEIKNLHPKATHHCYAFRLGVNGENYRANDDGEPSGSAGLPIYNQLLAHNITQVLVVVVRYYGGTKLGVGGLVKIYKESAKEVLSFANLVTQELSATIRLIFNYSDQSSVYQIVNKHHLEIVEVQNQEKIKLVIKVSQEKYLIFLELFKSLLNVKVL